MQTNASEKTLYERLGGEAAINAAVDIFYKKILADDRISHLFENTDMNRLMSKQREFLTYAFGGSSKYDSQSLRAAHKDLDLIEYDFKAVAEDLVATLNDLDVPQQLQDEVLAIVATTHDDVLNL